MNKHIHVNMYMFICITTFKHMQFKDLYIKTVKSIINNRKKIN